MQNPNDDSATTAGSYPPSSPSSNGHGRKHSIGGRSPVNGESKFMKYLEKDSTFTALDGPRAAAQQAGKPFGNEPSLSAVDSAAGIGGARTMTVKTGPLAKIPLLKKFAGTKEIPIEGDGADEVANAKGEVAELPDPTPEQMGAFKGYEPKALGDMVHNKFLNEIRERGGAEAVIAGLHSNPTNGLSESGAASGTSIEDRRRIYGENRIPQRKAKTLLQLMWIAFQDKILVSLTESWLQSLFRSTY